MLSPADVFTCAFRTPVSGNSEGTSKLIWPLEDMTWNSGAAMPLKVTERPANVVAGNKLVLSAVPMFETNTDFINHSVRVTGRTRRTSPIIFGGAA